VREKEWSLCVCVRVCVCVVRVRVFMCGEYIHINGSVYTYPCMCGENVHIIESAHTCACVSRILKITGLFCKRALQKRLHFAKETYDFKEPTNCILDS